MRRTSILLPLLLLLPACNDSKSTAIDIKRHHVIYEIDGCEYLVWSDGEGSSRQTALTHKGNCKYCLERAKSSGK